MLSVRTYLILMNVVVLCLLFPTISGYYWNKITELRDTQLENTLVNVKTAMEGRGEALSRGMSLGIHEAVAGFDFSFINTLLNQVVEQDQELTQCLLMDAKAVVFAHNDQTLVGTKLTQAIDKETTALFIEKFPKLFTSGEVKPVHFNYSVKNSLYVMSPIYRGKSLWGILRCAYSTKALEKEVQSTKDRWELELVSMRNTFISIIVFFFSIALLFTFLFTTKFVKAIGNLIRGVKRISAGDLTHNIDKKGLLIKELQSFANAFNDMTRNLHRSHEKLDEYNRTLEETVKQRTKELEATNKELEAFSYSVSHDLRAPLRAIDGYNGILIDEYSDKLDDEGRLYLSKVHTSATKMRDLIAGMLILSRVGRSELVEKTINLNDIIDGIISDLREAAPDKSNDIIVQDSMSLVADRNLVNIVFENLINNAWKYSGKKEKIEIKIGTLEDNPDVFFVKDNGAGFDMAYADKLFSPFKRMHSSDEFEGTGVGLATVERIVVRHSGKIWFESEVGNGATFYLSFKPISTP